MQKLFAFGFGVCATAIFYERRIANGKKWDDNWDGLQKEYKLLSNSNVKPNGKATITMVRHGQYHRTQGAINDNNELTELGKEQAIVTGKRLNEMDLKFDKIVCSKFKRAMQTAELVVQQLDNHDINEIQYDSDLNEGLATMIEPFRNYRTKQQFQEMIENNAPALKRGFGRYFHRRPMYQITTDHSNDKHRYDTLLIGHGNAFRYYLTRALQYDENGWARLSMHNCSISRMYIEDNGTVRVSHVGDTGHLPKHMQTNNHSMKTI